MENTPKNQKKALRTHKIGKKSNYKLTNNTLSAYYAL